MGVDVYQGVCHPPLPIHIVNNLEHSLVIINQIKVPVAIILWQQITDFKVNFMFLA